MFFGVRFDISFALSNDKSLQIICFLYKNSDIVVPHFNSDCVY